MPSRRLLSPRTQPTARLRTVHPTLPLALAIGWAAAFAGCAAPGEPKARHPVVPLIVSDLAAQQRGDAVVLAFTLPKESTEKEPLAAPPTVEIYRGAPPATGSAVPARPVDTLPGGSVASYEKDGHIEFRDPLPPADLTDEAGRQVRYWVRTRVSARRASADSNAVTLRVYPAPAAVTDLRATVTETAIDLNWTLPDGSMNRAPAGYRVYRADVEADAAAPPADASQAKLRGPLALLGQLPASEYRDTTFEFGRTYVYLVRSVAQFGSDAVESADSPPVFVAAKDVFPPAAPPGVLAAVVSPATPEGPAYIEITSGPSARRRTWPVTSFIAANSRMRPASD